MARCVQKSIVLIFFLPLISFLFQFVGHHDLHPDLYPVSFTSTGVPAMTTSQIAIAHEFITNLLKWKMERGETVLFATYGAEAGDSIKIGLKDAGLSLKEIKLPFGIIVTVISYKVEHPSSQEHHSLWFKFKHPSFANFDKYTMLERLIEVRSLIALRSAFVHAKTGSIFSGPSIHVILSALECSVTRTQSIRCTTSLSLLLRHRQERRDTIRY